MRQVRSSYTTHRRSKVIFNIMYFIVFESNAREDYIIHLSLYIEAEIYTGVLLSL